MPWRSAVERQVLDRRGRARSAGTRPRAGSTSRATKRNAPSYVRQLQHRSEDPLPSRGHEADRIGRVLRLVEGLPWTGRADPSARRCSPGPRFRSRLDDARHRQAERRSPARSMNSSNQRRSTSRTGRARSRSSARSADFARQALALPGRDRRRRPRRYLNMTSRICSENQGSRPRSSVTDGDDRDEDRRQRGDEAEQADDAHVQPAPPPPRRAAPGRGRLVSQATMPTRNRTRSAVEPEDRQDDLVRRDDRGQRRREPETSRAPTTAPR